MKKTFKTIALTLLVGILTLTSCSDDDHYHTNLIVGNGNINGVNTDSIYNVIINLINQGISKKTKSVDLSAVNKSPVIYDVKFLMFDANDIVISEYYTDITSISTPIDMNISGSVTKILAICNRDYSSPEIAENSTVGMSYNAVMNAKYSSVKQIHPIDEIAVSGETNGIDLNSGTIDIYLSPVPARLEIASITVSPDYTDITNIPDGVYFSGIYIHNTYEYVGLDQTTVSDFVDINDSSLFPYFTVPAYPGQMLSPLNAYGHRYDDIITNGFSVNPGTNELNKPYVWGYQVLPVQGSTPKITISLQLIYSTGNIVKYININSFNFGDGSGNDMEILIEQLERGIAYQMDIDCPIDRLSDIPGESNYSISATLTAVEWGGQDAMPQY